MWNYVAAIVSSFLYFVVVTTFFFQVMFFKWPSTVGESWGNIQIMCLLLIPMNEGILIFYILVFA